MKQFITPLLALCLLSVSHAFTVRTPAQQRQHERNLSRIRAFVRIDVAMSAIESAILTIPELKGATISARQNALKIVDTGTGELWYRSGRWSLVVGSLAECKVYVPIVQEDGLARIAAMKFTILTRTTVTRQGSDPSRRVRTRVMIGMRMESFRLLEDDAIIVLQA